MIEKSNNKSFFESGVDLSQKIYSLDDVPVKGTIPDWINGTYIRNGPGSFHLKNRRLNHWFDGMGALHRFEIKNGKVNYSCNFIDCDSYRHVQNTGELGFSEFATDPCKSIFRKIQSYVIPSPPKMTDNAKVNIGRMNDAYMALGETAMQLEIDPKTLQTIGREETLPGGFAYKTTAHPHFEGNSAYNLVVQFGMFSYYRIYDVSSEKRIRLCNAMVGKPAYMHGFGMSKKYFIVAQGPLVAVPLELLFWKKPFIENHNWLPKEGATFIIFEKETGKVKARIKTDPFFCFHHINAWEEGDDLVMDINAYDDAEIIYKYYLQELEKEDLFLPKGTLRRFRLNLRSKRITSEIISDACIELPRINYQKSNTSRDYGYTYGVSLHPEKLSGFYNSLVKINAVTGKADYWYEEHCYPGEPFFEAAPSGHTADEGVLMSIVLDSRNNNSFLLLLNALNMEEIARATLPEPVLYGFHGEFFPSV